MEPIKFFMILRFFTFLKLKFIFLLLSKHEYRFWIHISKNTYQSGSYSICTNVFLLR